MNNKEINKTNLFDLIKSSINNFDINDLNKYLQNRIMFLVNNINEEIYDDYGRKWKYCNGIFYFKDINKDSVYKEGLDCIHLLMSNSVLIYTDYQSNDDDKITYWHNYLN